MPWLPFYATGPDMDWIFELLSEDPEIAFLTSGGDRRWIAEKRMSFDSDRRVGLWHVPSGPLPLLRPAGQADGVVENPWIGWKEERQGANRSTPYFGAGHFGVFWLNARTCGQNPAAVGLSSFEWIGNRYEKAPDVTERFWRKLGRSIRKRAIRIPREGPWDGTKTEIWALPEALKEFVVGRDRDNNP